MANAALTEQQIDQIADAIKRVENSKKFPYGIKSVDTQGDEAKARRICKNTIRNNYARWERAGKIGCYYDYLADKYCPPTADRQGNINWKKNIHHLLKIND